MIEFKNKRVKVSVHQTIKIGEKFGEFFKFELGEEADITDETDSGEARSQLFKDLVEEATIRESAVKAINDKGQLDKVIQLLKGIFSGASPLTTEPPVQYYAPNDLIDDEEEMSLAQLKGDLRVQVS